MAGVGLRRGFAGAVTQVTARENENDRLPMTLIAIDETGSAAGALSLGISETR